MIAVKILFLKFAMHFLKSSPVPPVLWAQQLLNSTNIEQAQLKILWSVYFMRKSILLSLVYIRGVSGKCIHIKLLFSQ